MTGAAITPAAGSASRGRILVYCALLTLLVEFGAPYNGLIDVPVTFFLKNRLHMAAHEMASFRLLTDIPLFVAVVFGLARDRLDPLGRQDRGILIVFGAATALVYAGLALFPVARTSLLIGLVSLNVIYLTAASAVRGLLSVIGQQGMMTGRISTVWNIVVGVPLLLSYLFGGLLSQQLEGRNAETASAVLFLIGAAIMAGLSLYGWWRPKAVFESFVEERDRGRSLVGDIGRLLRTRAVYPAIAIWILWQFSPGSYTVLQVYITGPLHASDADWGAYNAIYQGAFIPTYLLYGYLCRRMPMMPLLILSSLIGIPQMVPLLFIHSAQGALWWAAPVGLMGGMAAAGYMDLIMRSCPRGLQGAMQGLAIGGFWLAIRFGDLFGTEIYDHMGGFVACVAVTTLVYALILPMLWFVPREVTAGREAT